MIKYLFTLPALFKKVGQSLDILSDALEVLKKIPEIWGINNETQINETEKKTEQPKKD